MPEVEGALGTQQTKPLQGVTLASWKGAGQCCLKHLLVISIQKRTCSILDSLSWNTAVQVPDCSHQEVLSRVNFIQPQDCKRGVNLLGE